MRSEQVLLYHGTSKASAIRILTEGSREDYLEMIGATDLARQISALVLDNMNLHGKDTWEIGVELHNRLKPSEDVYDEQDLWVRSLPYLRGAQSRSFHYGSTFVTSSLTRAYRYAAGNPYRSEFLRSLAGGYGICLSLGPPVDAQAKELRNQFPQCFELLENPSDPVVIEISGIQSHKLRTEDGDADIQGDLDLLDKLQELNVDPQLSFRLLELQPEDIVSIHDLKGWKLEEEPTLSSVSHLRINPREWLSKVT